jgi:hypothetical protein
VSKVEFTLSAVQMKSFASIAGVKELLKGAQLSMAPASLGRLAMLF